VVSQSLGRLFGSGSLGTIAVRVFSVGIAFLMAVVISRSLTVGETGTFFLVFSLLNVAAAFGRFGTDNLVLRASADAALDLVRDIRWMILTLAGASAIAFVALGFGLTQLLRESASFDTLPALGWIVAASVFPLSLSVLCGSVLRGNHRIAAGTFAELGTVPVIVTTFQAFLWSIDKASLVSALILLSFAAWAALGWSLPLMLITMRDRARPTLGGRTSFTLYLKNNLIRLSSMMGSALLIYAITWAPILVLGVVASQTEVAYFTVAQRVAVIVAFVATIQVSYMSPRIAVLFTLGQIEELNGYLRRGVKLATALVALPAVVFIVFPSWSISTLFGTRFEPAAGVLVLLVISSLLTVVGGQISSLMILCDLERALFLLNLVVAVTWVFCGLWLSLHWGAFGAAVVALVATGLTTTIGAILLRRRTGIISYLAPKGQRR
jgi:O-antigen/teichoic acid export membrane protein